MPQNLINFQDRQDELVQRISDCSEVITHLQTCPAWKVIKEDLERHSKQIDDQWQYLSDNDPKLREWKILKLAYKHLLTLTSGYEIDLKTAQDELEKIQNPESQIIRDYDTQSPAQI